MAVDNGLQHLSNSKSTVVVLFIEARKPLRPLGFMCISVRMGMYISMRMKLIPAYLTLICKGDT
jgi:hypothetical protein